MPYLPGDTLTILSLAIATHVLANILHEGAGHGGACLAVGGRPLFICTVSMECSAGGRLVTAGGTLMNFAAATLFFTLGRLTTAAAPVWKYFFWLSMTVNLLAAAGYFLFSGLSGFGDWAEFVRGLSPQWAWRIAMTAFGTGAYLLSVWISLRELRPLIGSDRRRRYLRAVELSRAPYFAGGILACVAGSLNPAGWILVALSAAASTFGGTSGLLWMPEWLKGGTIPLGSEREPAPIRRSWGWIVTAAVAACAFIAVLGPGLRFAK
ncbi:MAG TPA: hypothetical protein VME43_00910 [Bryobacteraceae bacterium]|nr:hypothetical protein [Bryobacteraceae bacterium]